MKAATPRSGGVQGRAKPLPCQGAGLSSETVQQSCPTAAAGKSTQLRIRLPARHAKRWLALPPGVREHAAAVVFGLVLEGVDLARVEAVASELREARTAITNALQLALLHSTPLDVRRVEMAVDRINTILGGQP